MSHYDWKLQYVLFRRIDSTGVYIYWLPLEHSSTLYSKLKYVHYPYISAIFEQKLEQLTPREFSMPVPIPKKRQTKKHRIVATANQPIHQLPWLGFQPGGGLRLPVVVGENLSLTQGEAHECRSGTQHLWHLGGIPIGGGGNLSKNQNGGLVTGWLLGEVRFRGEVRFDEKLFFSQKMMANV